MHVDAEAVVAPDDVLQDLVVPPVVRRVDDPLVLPAAPRMRAGRGERDAVRIDELAELRALLAHADRGIGEGRAPPRFDFDLRCDQLAAEMLLHVGAGWCGLRL